MNVGSREVCTQKGCKTGAEKRTSGMKKKFPCGGWTLAMVL